MIIRVRASAPTVAPHLTIHPIRVSVCSRTGRVLDFDVEARPLHWIASDYVSKEITAVAWKFIGEPGDAQCYLLGETDPEEMLTKFVEAYNEADMVTGHFIRGYDLPLLNGALTEYQLPALSDKLAQDTKIDLVKRSGLSGSQENLGAMLGLKHQKVHMDQQTWRTANRLTSEGLKRVRERVVGDVYQHIEMRQRLLDLGYLVPPRIWRSTGTLPTYIP